MNFTKREMILMMLYSPGTRAGLITELHKMRSQLGKKEQQLLALTDKVLVKLDQITDEDFDALPLYPDFDLPEGGIKGVKV